MKGFAVDAKIVERKRHYVVYLKEGAQIVDMLNVMGAHVALMDLENVRILKEMRNSVNRKVNCETANITKTGGRYPVDRTDQRTWFFAGQSQRDRRGTFGTSGYAAQGSGAVAGSATGKVGRQSPPATH